MTSEKKIEILENMNTQMEEEIKALKAENAKLKEQTLNNNVDSVIELQNELRDSIKSAKKQADEYMQLNRDMKRTMKEYENEMGKFMKNRK